MSAAASLPVQVEASPCTANVIAADLLAELLFVSPVAQARSKVPLLGSVLFRVESGRLSIHATDLNVTCATSVAARTVGSGSVAVQARPLVAAVRSFAIDRYSEVTLTVGADSKLTLASADASLTLLGTSATDYPHVTTPPTALDVITSISGDSLRKGLARVAFACTAEETRFQLNGALFEFTEHSPSVTLVATDGHRLSFIDVPCLDAAHRTARILVHRRALRQLAILRALNVEVGVTDLEVHFIANERSIAVRIPPGIKFPNYREVVPTPARHLAMVDRVALLRALRRAAIVASRRAPAVRIDLDVSKVTIATSASATDGSSLERLAADYVGPRVHVGVNAGYLSEFLAAAGDAPAVTLSIHDESGAIVVRPVAPHDQQQQPMDFTYVVMPMRLS